MPRPKADPQDTQPFSNDPTRKHRIYIPATWAAPGMGGGHPKLSGGVTVDYKTGLPAPRAYNRPDQRYDLTQSELLSRREGRAAAEYAETVILRGDGGRYEVRSRSGNNYDVSSDLLFCDCPDWLRVDESGYGIIRCKHIYLVMLALADESLPDGVWWSTARLAEFLGVSERVAQFLCQDGFFDATKVHGVWELPPLEGPTKGLEYIARLMFNPRDWSETLAVTGADPVYDSGAHIWTQEVTITNTAAFTLQGSIRLQVFNVSAGNSAILYDGLTETFEPVGSPYYTFQMADIEPDGTSTMELSFASPDGDELDYDFVPIAGKGII